MENLKKDYKTISMLVNGYRMFALLAFFCAIGISIFFGIMIYNVSNNNIMVVDGQGDILSASKTTETEMLSIEADNHIRLFYATYFTYDKLNYKKNIEKALFLSGKSALQLYETLQEKSWFDIVVNNDLKIESYAQDIKIEVDPNVSGLLHFKAIGFQKVNRGDQIETRHLDIKGTIQKSPSGRILISNPHGLLLDNLAITNNEIFAQNQ